MLERFKEGGRTHPGAREGEVELKAAEPVEFEELARLFAKQGQPELTIEALKGTRLADEDKLAIVAGAYDRKADEEETLARLLTSAAQVPRGAMRRLRLTALSSRSSANVYRTTQRLLVEKGDPATLEDTAQLLRTGEDASQHRLVPR
jgi:hypothetical protein